MDRIEMLQRLDDGADPVAVSVQKWEDILFRGGYDEGRENCALCCVFFHEFPCQLGDCPLKTCSDGVYSRWIHHQAREHEAMYLPYALHGDCRVCRELAEKMLGRLVALLPDSVFAWRKINMEKIKYGEK